MSNVQVSGYSFPLSHPDVGDFMETGRMMTFPLEYDKYDVLDLEEAELAELQYDLLGACLTASTQTVHDAEETWESRVVTVARESFSELDIERPSCMPSGSKENVDPEAVFLR